MMFECWEMIRRLGKIIKTPLDAQNISTFIDKCLQGITTYVKENKATNEASRMHL